MYRVYSLLIIIILLSGCATTQEQVSSNKQTDSIMDANIVVVVSQEKILGPVYPLQVDQNSVDTAAKHSGAGPIETFIAVALVNIFSQKSEHNRVNKLLTPINNTTKDLDFKKDLVRMLKEKCIFTTPERIVISNTKPEYDEDLLKLVSDFDNNSPTIVISAEYGFDSNYRVLIIDTAISLWLNQDKKPSYTTRTSYYSPPITPFIKTYIPSFGDIFLSRKNDKTSEKIHSPNISLWSNNRASTYRKYYAEGLEETTKMIVNALTNKHDTKIIDKRKIATYIDYHIPPFNNHGSKLETTSMGIILEEENNRMLLVTANGSLSSVYNGPVIKPSNKVRRYR